MKDPTILGDLTADDFHALVLAVAQLNGLDLETAGDAVAGAGDCPMFDPTTGLVTAELSDGRQLRLRWPMDEKEEK